MYTRYAMPDLTHSLRAQDVGFLKIIASSWGVDIDAPDAKTALPILVDKLIDPALVLEIVNALEEDVRQALDELILHSGRMAWSRFTQTYGDLREMGPGKRDREKPYLDPLSSTEALWYLGLIGRDFLRSGGELQECAYIPDDLLPLMPPVLPTEPKPPGRAASPGEAAHILPSSDRILDHTCTLLAALRLEDPYRSPAVVGWQPPVDIVHALLAAMKLVNSSDQPVPEAARTYLEMPRGKALAWLVGGWLESTLFNELRLMPGIICEGAWINDPVLARERVLAMLSEVPENVWWHLDSFIDAVFENEPDFQRPAGDFDTWLVREADTDESLAGFVNWQAVDGALVRFMISGPMHWLGLIDLASPDEEDAPKAFRLSGWASRLLLGKPIEDISEEDHPINVASDGSIKVNRLSSRMARYQISRFCLWESENDEEYKYQLSPISLRKGASQGLKVAHLEALLNKYGEAPPPSLVEALHRWEKEGGQVRIHPGVILRVENPKILQALRDSQAGRFLGDTLGAASALIHPDAVEKVAAALARLGYLSDIELISEDITGSS